MKKMLVKRITQEWIDERKSTRKKIVLDSMRLDCFYLEEYDAYLIEAIKKGKRKRYYIDTDLEYMLEELIGIAEINEDYMAMYEYMGDIDYLRNTIKELKNLDFEKFGKEFIRNERSGNHDQV